MQRMLKLIKHPNGLELVPEPELIAALAEAKAEGESITLFDVLEWHICNGWSYVQPEDIGALTDATIISDEGYIDDYGTWKPHTEDSPVYAHMRYAIEDPVELWAEGRSVWFNRSPEVSSSQQARR